MQLDLNFMSSYFASLYIDICPFQAIIPHPMTLILIVQYYLRRQTWKCDIRLPFVHPVGLEPGILKLEDNWWQLDVQPPKNLMLRKNGRRDAVLFSILTLFSSAFGLCLGSVFKWKRYKVKWPYELTQAKLSLKQCRVTDWCMFSPLSFPQLYVLAPDTTKFYKLKLLDVIPALVYAGLKTFSACLKKTERACGRYSCYMWGRFWRRSLTDWQLC